MLAKIIKTESIKNLDDLPLPDYEGIDMSRYTMTIDSKKGAMLITSRGCPWQCSFCGSANKKYIPSMSPERVIKEMRLLYDKYDIRGFYFGDDTFTLNKEWTINLCKLIKENFPDIVFRCTTRANCLDEERCRALKEAGCTIVSIGLESGDNNVLKAINKGETIEQQKEAVELCHKFGLKVKGFFIFGLPEATWESELKTIEMAKELQVDYADAYVFCPYPNTPIWNNPEKYKMKIKRPKDGNWNNFFQVGKNGLPDTFQFEHPNLTHEQIRELFQKFHNEINVKGLTY